jgi:hypothetical protein
MKTTHVILVCLVMASVISAVNLVGKYQNELGSVMSIDTFDGMTFSGIYSTAVSSNGSSLQAPVNGFYNTATRTEGTIAFSVNWKFLNNDKKQVISTTSWNGIVRSDSTIHTTWLLTEYCVLADEWDATTIGKDLFTKIQ